jgi:hypothetical protein
MVLSIASTGNLGKQLLDLFDHVWVGQYRGTRQMAKVPMFCAMDDCFRTVQNHWENIKKFGSCPLRSKTLVFPGFFAFLANCFGFPAYPCLQVLPL